MLDVLLLLLLLLDVARRLLDVFARRCSTLLDVCSTFLPWKSLKFYFSRISGPKALLTEKKPSKVWKLANPPQTVFFWSLLALEWPQSKILSDPCLLLRVFLWRSSTALKLIRFFNAIFEMFHLALLNFHPIHLNFRNVFSIFGQNSAKFRHFQKENQGF